MSYVAAAGSSISTSLQQTAQKSPECHWEEVEVPLQLKKDSEIKGKAHISTGMNKTETTGP